MSAKLWRVILPVALTLLACGVDDLPMPGPTTATPTTVPIDLEEPPRIPTVTPNVTLSPSPALTDDEGEASEEVTPTPAPFPAVASGAQNCPVEWFFSPAPEGCPDQPALRSLATDQPFEHGLMVWVEKTAQIYVFTGDLDAPAPFAAVPDPYFSGAPRDDPGITAPAGFVEPILGFGMVWRGESEVEIGFDVREALGWALDEETRYTTLYQCGTPVSAAACFLLLRGGGVVVMAGELAARWPVEEP